MDVKAAGVLLDGRLAGGTALPVILVLLHPHLRTRAHWVPISKTHDGRQKHRGGQQSQQTSVVDPDPHQIKIRIRIRIRFK